MTIVNVIIIIIFFFFKFTSKFAVVGAISAFNEQNRVPD